MKDNQQTQLKDRLEDELQQLQTVDDHDAAFDTTELSSYDNHPADNATDLTDQVTEMALDEHKEAHIEDIRAALQAIENGTYGTCKVCGKEIPFDRLDAVPTALTCIDHADHEPLDDETNPPEESILRASTDDPVKGNEQVKDPLNSFEKVEQYGSSDTPSDAGGGDGDGDFYK